MFDTEPPLVPSDFQHDRLGAPTSSVTALPATENSTSFNVELEWAGRHDGSGIAAYNIFVSVNGGAFTPWFTGTR